MILRQPLHQRRRHQQQLSAVTRNEISSHAGSLLNPADGTDIPTASRRSDRQRRDGSRDERTRWLMPMRDDCGHETNPVSLRRPDGTAGSGPAAAAAARSLRERAGGSLLVPASVRRRQRPLRRMPSRPALSDQDPLGPSSDTAGAVFVRRMLGRGSATTTRSASRRSGMTSLDRSLMGA